MEANKVNRRKFLKVTGLTGAMLAVGFDKLAFGSEESTLRKYMPEDLVDGESLNPFVTISENGDITIMAHIPELGQGIFQGIPAVMAEELGVSMDQVTIVKTSALSKYGRQSIGGSRSIRSLFQPMRQLGAATKDLFLRAAAQQWMCSVDDCTAKNARVYRKGSSTSLSFAELVKEAAKLDLNDNPKLKSKSEFEIIGKATKRPDLAGKVDGTADYGIDAQTEGLLYATVEHCPTLQGGIKNYDKSAALDVKGVVDVLEIDRSVYGKTNKGIAVVAESYYSALQGRKKLNVQWDNLEFNKIDTEQMFSEMKNLAQEEGLEHVEKGDFIGKSSTSTVQLEATYELPYLSHSCMEPMNATVHVREDNSVEVWASSQSPQVQRQFARELGIPAEQAEEKIKVHMPFIGGGFGRRSMNDSLEECFQISKALRKPIKLIWTREDDTQQGPFRQGTVHQFKANFNESGKASGLQLKMVSSSITAQARPKGNRVPFEVMEAINTHYEFEDLSIRFNEYRSQIPIHWWRSVFGATNGVAYEAFIDEVAHKEGADPLKFRKEKLRSEARFIKVLERLEKESNWNQSLGENEGKGIAIVESFGSIVAHAVFLKKENGQVSIPKVVSVVDCGIYVNPDQVKAQTEGNIIFGLTAAIKDPITFKNGAAEQANFDTYRMLRINEAPGDIQIHIMENEEAPGGVGEPGLPPIGSALLNAVHDLTGKRIRKLPFDLQSV